MAIAPAICCWQFAVCLTLVLKSSGCRRFMKQSRLKRSLSLRFLNLIAELNVDRLPGAEAMLARLLRVEYALGRTRELEKGPRTIDLDLLLYGDTISDTEFLKLPHPRLHLRRFVLVPLAELAPKLIHPTLKKPISELLEQLDDTAVVKLWKP